MGTTSSAYLEEFGEDIGSKEPEATVYDLDEISSINKNVKELEIMGIRDGEEFPDLSQFKCLEKLYIDSCDFNTLSDSLTKLPDLKTLKLYNTSIENIPEINGLENLSVKSNPNLSEIPLLLNLRYLEFSTELDTDSIFANKSIIKLKIFGETQDINETFDYLEENIDKLNPNIVVIVFDVGYRISPNKDKFEIISSKAHCTIFNWTYPIYLSDDWMNRYFGFYNIQKLKAETLEKKCEIINRYTPSEKWVSSIKKYFKRLSSMKKGILEDYTYFGDTIINTFYRDGLTASVALMRKTFNVVMNHPDKPQERLKFKSIIRFLLNELKDKKVITINGNDVLSDYFLEKYPKLITSKSLDKLRQLLNDENRIFVKYVTDYFLGQVIVLSIKTLTDIFINAPPLDRDIIVFRGTERFMFGDTFPPTTSDMSHNIKGILSTTNDVRIALRFGEENYVYIIYISKGMKCIPIFNTFLTTESEIIFPHNSTIKLYDCNSVTRDDKTTNICETELREGDIKFYPEKYLDINNWD